MIKLGNHSYCYGVQRGAANDVIVGNYTSIAENVRFDSGFNHNPNLISTFPFKKIWDELPSNILLKGDINIGHDCWLGEDVIVFSGITIASGSIIGAGSIITKNVPPYSVVVGAPMKIIKKRYTLSEIDALLKIEWWNWPNQKVRDNVDKLMSDNIQEFINLHK